MEEGGQTVKETNLAIILIMSIYKETKSRKFWAVLGATMD